MKTLRLILSPLTEDGFAPFGSIIQKQGQLPQEINYGQTRKYASLARLDVNDQDGHGEVHIYRSRPVHLPFRIKVMECHPHGSQAFMPLHDRPFPIVVAPPADHLEASAIRGFLSNGKQGINLHKGVWHHYQLSLVEPSDYLVIDRRGPGNNTLEQHLDTAVFIEKP
jgi:ureidoglycolate lyase